MQPVTGRPDVVEQDQIASGVGALLKSLRAAQGMSLRDLEKRSGIARSTISRLERGLRRPRCATLGWLAWGLAPDDPAAVEEQLAQAAADSLIAESRWSQRSRNRHAERALLAAGCRYRCRS